MVLEPLSSYQKPQMTAWQVIRWWEIRRLLYNAILFVIGIASIFAMEWFFDKFIPPGDEGIEPIALAFGVVAYAILANACYTLGWVVELIGRRADAESSRARAENLFLVGIWISCLLTTAPLWFGFIGWLVHR